MSPTSFFKDVGTLFNTSSVTTLLEFGFSSLFKVSLDAFNESLIKQIENHPDRHTNGFLNQLTIVKRRSGFNYMKFLLR